jgi:YggT family protein
MLTRYGQGTPTPLTPREQRFRWSLSKACAARYASSTLQLLSALIDLYSLVVLGAVITSWLQLSPDHPVVRVTSTLTEPVLAPLRRLLPPMAGLDLSPMLLLFLLRLLSGLALG